MEIKLKSTDWCNNGRTFVRGYCFDSFDTFLQGDSLLSYFDNIASESEFLERLISANGLFSVIISSGNFNAIAVDNTRIYPLYFTNSGVVSDDPHTLPNEGLSNSYIVDYYKATSTIPEGYTLIKNILQVKPSHFAVFQSNNNSWRQVSYQNHCCKLQDESVAEIKDVIDAFEHITQRLIESSQQRQIVIPLSGGYDSRLIATMLAKYGYKNVIAYTVGKKDSSECVIASKVAQMLNIPCYIVDITSENAINECYANKNEFMQYFHHVGNYSNFTWMFEYAAIKQLKKQKVLSTDAIFVPGHSGDSIAGSHIVKANVTPADNARSLTRKILYISNEFGYKRTLRSETYKYFKLLLEAGFTPYSVYQNYILQNRQCHNIVNSARVYEFFGYGVRLPLWDKQLVSLFKKIPYSQLHNCALYNTSVTMLFSKYKVNFLKQYSYTNTLKVMLKRMIKRLLPNEYIKSPQVGSLGEWEVCKPMLDELIKNGKYSKFKKPLNSNVIMKEWYLMQVCSGNG